MPTYSPYYTYLKYSGIVSELNIMIEIILSQSKNTMVSSTWATDILQTHVSNNSGIKHEFKFLSSVIYFI